MNRDENDLRDALRELERRADQAGGPSVPDLLASASDGTSGRHRRLGADSSGRARWLAPLAAAVVVAGAAGGVVAAVSSDDDGSPAGGGPTPTASRTARPTPTSTGTSAATPTPTSTSSTLVPSPTTSTTVHQNPTSASSAPGEVLAAAAGLLDADSSWHAPAGDRYFYVRTTDATTWTAVNGRRSGQGKTSDGERIGVPGCRNGKVTADSGQEGSCTLNDVSHYLADAPTAPAAWDAYLEGIAPGAKAAGAQGKIIVQVLHEDLISPRAKAALLRYTETCPGLRSVTVKPVAERSLVGITCTSMAAGSYGLAFDANTRAFAGFVPVNEEGTQDDAAEVILRTGIVSQPGRTP